MASEIRVNSISSRSGLSTITFGAYGVEISGITTIQQLKVSSGTEATFAGVVTATTFDGNVTGNVTGNLSGNVNAGVVTATSSIVVGNSFINPTSIGIGTTTTAGRNAGVGTAVGTMIFNTTTGAIEVWGNNDGWDTVSNLVFRATGGTEDTSSRPGWKLHIFTEPGPFSVTGIASPSVEYLVVAGGGGGGGSNTGGNAIVAGGGGGAGGYRTGTLAQIPVGEYDIQAGGGGNAGGPGSVNATQGTPSYISGTGITPIISTGGGRGGTRITPGGVGPNAGGPGGSGGGASYNDPGGAGNAGGYTPVEGYRGGNNPGASTHAGCGGGGASQQGEDAATNRTPGTYGGDGTSSSITGSPVTRAGGGGGGGGQPGTGGAGGAGGGGNGAPSANMPASTAGGTNTGGGGGGAGSDPTGGAVGSNGGSGIVIIAYPTA